MIKVTEYKEPQHNLKSEKFFAPSKLYLPLSQHTGSPSSLCVQKNDLVSEGMLLAKEDGFISTQLHAPRSGKIVDITNWYHPILKQAPAIVLKTDDELKKYSLSRDPATLGNDELLAIIKNSGLVGMGGGAFPTHAKLDSAKEIDTLIINGCECEPYLACDYRLMIENATEIFKAIGIISKLVNPKEVIFAVEKNKPQAIKKLNLHINTKNFDSSPIKLFILPTAYPQGEEKWLIQATTAKKVGPEKLPLDVGCLVLNVATCFAIYEAVYLDKPLIERLVSFCGDALRIPKNIWVKIGTTIRELFEAKVLEFIKEPKRVICGGPMMGIALDSLDYPILKGSGGFLFLKEEELEAGEEPCIRCSRCVDVCPMNLLPLEYVKRVKKDEFASLADFNIIDCTECGCCSYVCPGKIPITHYIKTGKKYGLNNN